MFWNRLRNQLLKIVKLLLHYIETEGERRENMGKEKKKTEKNHTNQGEKKKKIEGAFEAGACKRKMSD